MKKYFVLLALAAFSMVSVVAPSYAAGKKRTSWAKICTTSKKDKARRNCSMVQEQLSSATGKTTLRVMIPLKKRKRNAIFVSVSKHLNVKRGMLLRVDKNKVVKLVFLNCKYDLCTAGTFLTPSLKKQLLRGRHARIFLYDGLGKLTGYRIPLRGYATAYKGKGASFRAWIARRYYAGKRKRKEYNEQMFDRMFGS